MITKNIWQHAVTSKLDYVKENRGSIATMDKDLKNKVKNLGGSIISITNDRIVLEK